MLTMTKNISFVVAILSAPTVLAFAPGLLSSSSSSSSRSTTTARTSPPRPSSPQQLGALVNIAESTERDMGTFDEWATACGVQRSEGFQLTSEDGLDWSVMTTQPLQEGDPVLYVPGEMVFSSQAAQQELAQLGNVQDAVDYLGRLGAMDQVPQFYLFLKTLLEYERGDQSPWFPWLDSLPRLYYNAVSMTDFCYECLPPLVFALSRAERVKFQNFCDALAKIDFLSGQTKNNGDLAKWAFNVVYTRSFGSNGDKRIAPMADMVRVELN